MLQTRWFALFASFALVASCDSSIEPDPAGSAQLRVINATPGALDVVFEGQTIHQGLGVANVSGVLVVPAGAHQVTLRTAGGASTNVSIDPEVGQTVTVAATPATTSIAANVIADTGAIVPANKSKLRVIHLAPNAGAIEIWRTQPDFATPTHISTPFPYQAASPYLQSDPGNWEVFVTPAGATNHIATTGAVAVPAGERRTVVLLDSAGVLKFRVLSN